MKSGSPAAGRGRPSVPGELGKRFFPDPSGVCWKVNQIVEITACLGIY